MNIFFVALAISSQKLVKFAYQAYFSFRLPAAPTASHKTVGASRTAIAWEVYAIGNLTSVVGQDKSKGRVTFFASIAAILGASNNGAFSFGELVEGSLTLFAGSIVVVDKAAWEWGLAVSFGIDSESWLALATAILGYDFAVGDVLHGYHGGADSTFQHWWAITLDAVEICIVFSAFGNWRGAFSIHQVVVFGAYLASIGRLLDASWNFDILADSWGGVGLEPTGTGCALALRIEGKTAVLTVVGGIVADAIDEFVI